MDINTICKMVQDNYRRVHGLPPLQETAATQADRIIPATSSPVAEASASAPAAANDYYSAEFADNRDEYKCADELAKRGLIETDAEEK